MDSTLQDVRYAIRRLLKSPGFTLVAVLTLAIGIGANSAIFSVVRGVLLRPLPFAEPDRLALLYTAYPDDDTRYPLSAPDFMSLREGAASFMGMAAAVSADQTLTDRGDPRQLPVGRVSADYLEILGVAPVLGRGFRPEENQPGANGVALLAHDVWQTQFGGDPGVIGQTITLNGIVREIVGVLPPGFDHPAGRAIYYPLEYTSSFSAETAEGRRAEFLEVVGRLAPGTTLEQAAAEVEGINARLRRAFPQTNSENITLSISPLRDELLGKVRQPLLVLLGAVGVVLLIACVNVANLLLARAAAREGEVAVRVALGAGHGRLIRQLLTESVLLGAIGGTAGLALAHLGMRALLALRPEEIPRIDEIGIDLSVVGFTALVAMGTGLLVGLVPAARLAGGVASSIRESGRDGLGNRSANRFRGSLVMTETALAVVLLVGAGLLLRSFLTLTAVDPGFRTQRIVTFSLSLPATGYAGGAPIVTFYQSLLERISTLPEVESVAASSQLPFSSQSNIWGFSVENAEPPAPGFVQDAFVAAATPDYFATLAIPIRQGRALSDGDVSDGLAVGVVNEAFVRRYLAGGEAVGHRLSFDGSTWVEIVGVVGDTPQHGLNVAVRPQVYLPHEQFTSRSMAVAVRSAGDPLALAGAVRAELRQLDPNLPLERFVTGDQLVAGSIAQPRFYTLVLGVFASIALLLAAIGIFGMISYAVTQRTREIGVRMALGAAPSQVVALVVGGAMAPMVAGIGIGVATALAVAPLLGDLLFGVAVFDPLTLAAVIAVLTGVAVAASLLPARRAARVHPMTALRSD